MDHRIWKRVFRTSKRKEREGSKDGFGLLVLAETFVRMFPPFLYICAFFTCTFLYAYAILGVELFTEARTACDRARFVQGILGFVYHNILPSILIHVAGDIEARFCDLASAYLSLFQVSTTCVVIASFKSSLRNCRHRS